MTDALATKLAGVLDLIYPAADTDFLSRELIEIMGLDPQAAPPPAHRNNWDQSDILVITYADSIQRQAEKPLVTLHHFLEDRLRDTISAVHILPFFPYSSDDGFSVIDYLSVNEAHGTWEDIERIGEDFRLMADLVLNHVSAHSQWFENYKRGEHPGKGYFVEASPEDDLSLVVRPRTSPLLAPVTTVEGQRYVWCTFSEDQVDLNFANPEVLREIVRVIRYYMDRGITIFRLDAVAFMWKEVGTPCIHLQQAHALIQALRLLIEHRDPRAIVITETNVPVRENLTYFGNANEAHVIYNFSLPPLLLHTLITGNCRHLKSWLMSMPPAQTGTTYLNFISSHDGVGLRPADGLLSEEDKQELIATMERFGGKVSYRRISEEADQPYEINIALYDALKGTVEGGPDQCQLQRFLCAHTIMLGLEGIPAFNILSLLGTENDYQRLKETGRYRSINRSQWDLDKLEEELANPLSHHQKVFTSLQRLIAIRKQHHAFHPNAAQYILHLGLEIFGFWRQSTKGDESIFCIHNVSSQIQQVPLSSINLMETEDWHDLISGMVIEDLSDALTLKPYQSVWLCNQPEDA